MRASEEPSCAPKDGCLLPGPHASKPLSSNAQPLCDTEKQRLPFPKSYVHSPLHLETGNLGVPIKDIETSNLGVFPTDGGSFSHDLRVFPSPAVNFSVSLKDRCDLF